MGTKKIKYKVNKKIVISSLELLYSNMPTSRPDVARSLEFVNDAFDNYENLILREKVRFAFLVPMRLSRFSDEYWPDAYEFLPALKYLDKDTAYSVLAALPPAKIEMYGKKGKPSSGVLIFVPIYSDMLLDYRNKLLLRRKMRKTVNEAVKIAKRCYQIDFIGLGGIIPKVTDYGNSIKGLGSTKVTTGHAGTTWLILETFNKVKETYFNNDSIPNVGIIGGGAIGSATADILSSTYPNLKFIIHDKRPDINHKNKKGLESIGVKVKIAKSNKDLLETSDIIISAVTSKISIKDIGLKNKVIIDDSQPGSFDRKEVHSHGGKLIWVVASDNSASQIATRRSGYSYGPMGLVAKNDLWGCEAEVAGLAYSNSHELVISRAVKVDDVMAIGEHLKNLGIRPAEFQSYGRLLNNNK